MVELCREKRLQTANLSLPAKINVCLFSSGQSARLRKLQDGTLAEFDAHLRLEGYVEVAFRCLCRLPTYLTLMAGLTQPTCSVAISLESSRSEQEGTC